MRAQILLLALVATITQAQAAPGVKKGKKADEVVKPVLLDSGCQRPEYPKSSVRNEESGVLLLRLLVGVDGRVLKRAVEISSGYRDLDKAALRASESCQFRPGRMNGKAAEMEMPFRYAFTMDGPGDEAKAQKLFDEKVAARVPLERFFTDNDPKHLTGAPIGAPAQPAPVVAAVTPASAPPLVVGAPQARTGTVDPIRPAAQQGVATAGSTLPRTGRLPDSERVFLQADDDDPKEQVWTYWRKTESGCSVLDENDDAGERFEWSGQCVSGYVEGCGQLATYRSANLTLDNMRMRQSGCYVAGKKNGKIETTLFREDSNRAYALTFENGKLGDVVEGLHDVPLLLWQLVTRAEKKAAQDRVQAARQEEVRAQQRVAAARQAELEAQQARQAQQESERASNISSFLTGLVGIYSARKGVSVPESRNEYRQTSPVTASSGQYSNREIVIDQIGPRCVTTRPTKPRWTEITNRCAEGIRVHWQDQVNIDKDPMITPGISVHLAAGESHEAFTPGAIRYMACPDTYSGFKVFRQKWGCYYEAK